MPTKVGTYQVRGNGGGRTAPPRITGKIGGAGAVQVGQDQHTITPVNPPQGGRGEREQGVQVCVERYFESFGFQRQLPQEPGSEFHAASTSNR